MLRPFKKIGAIFLVCVVCVALWKGGNGDLGHVVDFVWAAVNQGADVVTSLWNAITGIFSSGSQ